MLVENILYKEIPIKGADNYLVSACGKIFMVKYNKPLATWVHRTKWGYPSELCQLSLPDGRKHFKVHRLVALSWIGQPPSAIHTDINHIDGDSLNNHCTNLEWATKSQNQRHAVNTGLKGKGNILYNSELSDDDVHKICSRLVDGCRPVDIAKEFNCSTDIVRKIKSGDTYFHVRTLYNIPHNYISEFSYSTIKWVCKKILEGYSDKAIVNISSNKDLTVIDIKRIRYKIRYKNISDEYF